MKTTTFKIYKDPKKNNKDDNKYVVCVRVYMFVSEL